ncbi:MAG: sulfotransferase [Azospira sp.]|nr:sulfotransferase [Azospira sp.]
MLSSRCSVFTSSATDIQTITQGYLDFLDSLDITATYVVDKMPHNFEKLGLIALCFPQATILHVERDPVDTCLSCYFQNFSNDRHGYSDDLADLGRHYLY